MKLTTLILVLSGFWVAVGGAALDLALDRYKPNLDPTRSQLGAPDAPEAPVEAPLPPPPTTIAKLRTECARRGLGTQLVLPYRSLSKYRISCEAAS